MKLDRAEAGGIALAVAGHVALFGLLSLSLMGPPERLPSMNPPIDVDLVGPEAVAPDPVPEAAPAASSASAPAEPVVVPEPEPVIAPQPTPPPPKPVAKAPVKPAPPKAAPPKSAAKSAPAKPAPAKPVQRGSGLTGLGSQLGDTAKREAQGDGKGTTKGKGTPAAKSGAEIRRTISVSINAEVRGPWNACKVSGVDVDQLVTTIVFRLNPDGTLAGLGSVKTSGVNESNRFQQARFEECARNAIVRAAPFTLPREDYDFWKSYTLDFSKR